MNSNLEEEKRLPGLVEGELYYNDKDLDLGTFIPICIEHFKKKCKTEPTIAIVHESDWKEIDLEIPMYASINILPGHVLVGKLRRTDENLH